MTTTDTAAADIRSRLNLDHITLLADAAGSKINGDGWAAVQLTPGDMTRYHLVITPNEAMVEEPDGEATWERIGRGWTVTLVNCSGAPYPWNPDNGEVHASYAAEKWTTDRALWTGVVVATFLNALAARLSESP